MNVIENLFTGLGAMIYDFMIWLTFPDWLATVILFYRAVNALFDHYYSAAFHAIIGVVIAATIMIVPFGSFTASMTGCIVNVICIVIGIVAALALDKFNQKFDVE